MQLMLSYVLLKASAELQDVSDTPHLDAELLLAKVLRVSRSYLYAWPEKILSEQENLQFENYICRRKTKEPVAYIIGEQEFWSLSFNVTPATLIPRPETECLVEFILQTLSKEEAIVADLGTGSGAIAIALAFERPQWLLHAVDASQAALNVAKENAAKHQINNIKFYQGSWCQALPLHLSFDVIVSNPPYIAEQDSHLEQGALPFEPKMALASGEDGLEAIKEIIQAAYDHLKIEGWLVLEHGYNQAQEVNRLMKSRGYVSVSSYPDYAGIERFTVGKKSHAN